MTRRRPARRKAQPHAFSPELRSLFRLPQPEPEWTWPEKVSVIWQDRTRAKLTAKFETPHGSAIARLIVNMGEGAVVSLGPESISFRWRLSK